MASARLVVSPKAPSCHPVMGPLSLLVRMARFKDSQPSASAPASPESSSSSRAPDPAPVGGIRGILERVFGIDVRSLALFRICLGLLMICDLLYRAQDIKAHYTDAGVMPIALVSLYQQQHWWWSIHTLHPALPFEIVLFLIAGFFSFSLMVGYRTRMVSIVCWALLISVQNRNTMILTGGDSMIRVLAFWAMFLPMGACWSVDRLLDKSDTPLPPRIFSVASAGMILQLASIYFFGALMKSGSTWRTDYTASYYALSLGQFATPLSKVLVHHPDLLKMATFTTWNLEFLAPFLLLASAFSGPLRTVIVLAYMGFHISLGINMELGLFPFIASLCWLIMMPAWFWQTFFRLTARLSWKNPAFVGALATRTAGWRARLHPQTVSTHTPRAVQCLAAFFLLYTFCWNMRVLNFTLYQKWFPISINWIGEVVRIDQDWSLFAPNPLQTQEWMVVPAKLADGTEVDLKTGTQPVTYAEPPVISATYYNERWRKFLMNISESATVNHTSNQQSYCFTYASYLCNRWNETHPPMQRVTEVSLKVERSQILPNARYAAPEHILLFTGNYGQSTPAPIVAP